MAYRRLDETWVDDSDEKLYRRTGETFTEVSPSVDLSSYVKYDDLDTDNLLADATIGGSPLVTEAETPELGSNSNGYWAKFPSGLMICYRRGAVTSGTLYSFPLEFFEPPSIVSLCDAGQAFIYGNGSTTASTLRLFSSGGGTGIVPWIAIGKWK